MTLRIELTDEDWLRRDSWDLPRDVEGFLAVLESLGLSLTAFMHTPAAEAMPESLRSELMSVGFATVTVERPVAGYLREVEGEVQRVRPHMRKMKVTVGGDLDEPEPARAPTLAEIKRDIARERANTRAHAVAEESVDEGTEYELVNVEPDTDTPEWDECIEEIREQGMGNCYSAAMTFMLREDILGLVNPRVVQASVLGRSGEVEGKRFWHSWIEVDSHHMYGKDGNEFAPIRMAIDFASGNSHMLEATTYRFLGQVEDVMEYDHDEAILASIEYRYFGLWRPAEEHKGYL
jgi:hypothetical protein